MLTFFTRHTQPKISEKKIGNATFHLGYERVLEGYVVDSWNWQLLRRESVESNSRSVVISSSRFVGLSPSEWKRKKKIAAHMARGFRIKADPGGCLRIFLILVNPMLSYQPTKIICLHQQLPGLR